MRGQHLLLLPNGAHQALLLGTGRLLESLLRSSPSRTAAGIIVVSWSAAGSSERSFFGLAVRRPHNLLLLERNERTFMLPLRLQRTRSTPKIKFLHFFSSEDNYWKFHDWHSIMLVHQQKIRVLILHTVIRKTRDKARLLRMNCFVDIYPVSTWWNLLQVYRNLNGW
jgi:hypothetical protein